MQQDILIIGVLFPAIPLMMVNFGNRYTVLANLIRHLHDEVLRANVSPKDAERFLLQINRPVDLKKETFGILWRDIGAEHLVMKMADQIRQHGVAVAKIDHH